MGVGRLEAARRRAEAAVPPIAVDELRRIARKLDRLVDELAKQEDTAGLAQDADGTAKSGWRWAIDARVARRASRLRAAIDEAGAVYLPERLHDVRIAVKKLRYAVELGADASGARRERRSARADARAGAARPHARSADADRARPGGAGVADAAQSRCLARPRRLVASLDDDCRRLHARYMRARSRCSRSPTVMRARPVADEARHVGVA